MDDQDDVDQEQRLINEGESSFQKGRQLYLVTNRFLEYKTWKKNSPFLYDMILR